MKEGPSGERGSGAAGRQRPGRGPSQARAEQNVIPVKVFDARTYLRQNSLCSWADPATSRTLGLWPQFFRQDPRIALGKHSPLEKEILRLGGVRSAAARRFLMQRHREEQEELRGLPPPSWAPARELRCPGMTSVPCARLPGAWTARVRVPCGRLQLPPRERDTVARHVARTRLARGLPAGAQARGAGAERLGGPPSEDSLSSLAPRRGGEEGPEPPGPRPDGAQGRCPPRAPGLAHRNRLAAAAFPGDLLLMARSFTAWGMHVGDPARARRLQEPGCPRPPGGY